MGVFKVFFLTLCSALVAFNIASELGKMDSFVFRVLSVAGVHHSSIQNDTVALKEGRALEEDATNGNPWHGWQPKISASMECTWQQCLQPDHNCTTCRDEFSDWGDPPPVPSDNWIPDVTVLHRMYLQGHDSEGNAWPPPLGEGLCHEFGKDDTDWQLFHAVPITTTPSTGLISNTRIFCGVYTMLEQHHTSIRAMRETWAPRCDGFLAFSTQSDPRIPAMEIQHDGPEEYGNMWQKSRAIWKFIGDHYLNDFDYFILGGEDIFLLPDNLRFYLATLDSGPEDDHFVGRRMKGGPEDKDYFNSGGAGYVLSRSTLRKYVTEGFEHPDCWPQRRSSCEDVLMAQCLRSVFGIGLTNTRDEQGRERFHPFTPGKHFTMEPSKAGWYEEYTREWGLKTGKDCCAPSSVSFHYIKEPAHVRHLHSMLHDNCNSRYTQTG